MNRLHRIVIAIAVVAAIAWTCRTARADYPSYLILRAPATVGHHHARGGYHPGRAYATSGRAYAYGWFGASPRAHWSRHFGYSKNFTQWTRQ